MAPASSRVLDAARRIGRYRQTGVTPNAISRTVPRLSTSLSGWHATCGRRRVADYPYNTARWKRLRTLKLHSTPTCEPCKAAGQLIIANTVDHIVAISAGGPAFPPLDQLTSCCTSCHSIKTARGPEAGAVRSTRKVQPRKGCDASGNPTDPAHPWHVKHAYEKQTAVRESATLRKEGAGLQCRNLRDDAIRAGAGLQSGQLNSRKSLKADALGTAVPLRNQLVSKGNRRGR